MNGTGLRRAAFPIRLARARLAAGGERLALVAIGIVAGAAAIAAVLGGRLVMQDRALAQATAALPSSDRSLTVAWFGAYGGNWRPLDRDVTNELVALTGREPARAMLYREASVGGRFINLRGAVDLGRYVHLESGRLPKPCTPSYCEVLRIEGTGPIPSKPTIRLVQVGRAALDPDAPFASFIQPATTGIVSAAVQYHRPQPSPVVLAEGVGGVSLTPELASFFRSYAWFLPVRPGDVHPWSVATYTKQVDDVRAELTARSDSFEVTAPTDQLAASVASSRVAARRLLLLGGEAGALLLAFTVLAAAALRHDVGESRRRLLWAGARRWQVELQTFTETGTVALLGTIAGWAIGAAVAAAVASAAGSPAWPVVQHALLSHDGLLAAALAFAASALLLYLTVRAPALQLGRVGITPLDVAAIAAVVVVAVGYARGSVNASSLAGGGTGAFVLLVPALVTFAAAVAAARLLLPTLRGLGRLGRRGPVSLRLAALSLARNPGGAAVTATFLVASLGLAIFATTYRSTLVTGQRDEAAYAAPAPYVVDENLGELVPVLHGWTGGAATPLIRLSGNVPSAATFTFLAMPSSALPATGGWRGDFASASLPELAKAIDPGFPTGLRSTRLPPGRRFELPVSNLGDRIGIRAYFRSSLGDFRTQRHPRRTTEGSTHGRPARSDPLRPVHAHLVPALSPERRTRRLSNRPDRDPALERAACASSTCSVRRASTVTPVRARVRGLGRRLDGGVRRAGRSRAPRLLARHRPPDDVPVRSQPSRRALRSFRCSSPRMSPRAPVSAERSRSTSKARTPLAGQDRRGSSGASRRSSAARWWPTGSLPRRCSTRSPLDSGRPTSSGRARCPRRPRRRSPSPRGPSCSLTLRADPLARGWRSPRSAATAALALALALLGPCSSASWPPAVTSAASSSIARRRAPRRRRSGRTSVSGAFLLVGAFGLARTELVTGAVLSALVLSLVEVTASSAQPEPPLRLAFDPALLAAVVHRIRADRGGGDRRFDGVLRGRNPPSGAVARARPRRQWRGRERAIELRDVFRVHSTPEGDAAALQGLSLTVAQGEVVAVLGPSGAGKSTLLRILAGLEAPSAGTVRVLGEEIGKLPPRRLADYRATRLGYVDQHYTRSLAPELTARALVSLQLGLRGERQPARLARADQLLERVGLGAKRDRRASELSGGEQQRVALCAALAHGPGIFLADEPTGELDAGTADVVYGLIGELVREHGCTTLIVSHDPESAKVADRIVRIRDGRLSEEWTREEQSSDAIVVGRGGWLRLPEELLQRAGIADRARAKLEKGAIVVSPVGPAAGGGRARRRRSADRSRRQRARSSPRRAASRKGYGATRVLDALDAEFRGGRLHAVTGPSGSGKTTFLHLLAGLELPQAGEIEVDGALLTALDRTERAAKRRASIAYVGQQAGLVGHLSALENVELALTLRGVADPRPAAFAALEAVGLAERTSQRVARLSHGERARVAIARAVASRPKLLLADEPTSRLDGANALAVALLLARLARDTGAAVVCATHDPLVIEQADDELRLV